MSSASVASAATPSSRLSSHLARASAASRARASLQSKVVRGTLPQAPSGSR